MILVNTPGHWNHVYGSLRHASWNGCTPTDLVFPFFLFIVGVAMWYSFKKYDHQLSPKLWRKIIVRALLIFIIGVALNTYPFYDQAISEIRIMGVLQRIAVAFFFGALICVAVPQRFLHWAAGVILIAYWLILRLWGGDSPYALETNVVRKVDIAIFGEEHLYHGFGIAFDPEGLLSSLPAVGTVIIGFIVGRYIDRTKLRGPAISTLLLCGVLGIGLGLLWNIVFPINKPLWTSSYVVYTGGIAIILLTLFLWLMDIRNWKKWAHPLIVFGLNPLFIYALSIVIIKTFGHIAWESHGEMTDLREYLYEAVFVPLAGNMNGSLLFALCYVALHWFIAWWMYRKRIFIKI